MEDNSKLLFDIHTRVTRMEEKLDAMTDVKDTAREAKEVASVAMQSTKSAHHRIDEMKKDVDVIKDNQTWLWRTALGAVLTALASGAIAIFWKGVGG